MLNKTLIYVFVLFFTFFSKSVLAFDFPECDLIPVKKSQVLLGFDHGEGELYHTLIKQSLMYENAVLCGIDSSKALNQYVPWNKSTNLEQYYGWGIFALSLLLALLVFSLLPSRWREHLTIFGMIFITGVTWLIASVTLTALNNKKIPQQYIYTQLIKVLTPQENTSKWFDVHTLREFDSVLKSYNIPIKQNFDGYRFQLVSGGMENDVKLANKESQVSSFSYQIVQQKYENKQRKVKVVQVNNQNKVLGKPKWFDAEDIDFTVQQIEFKNKLFSPRQPLNIRTGPSINYKRLNRVLTMAMRVVPTGKAFGDWWEVVIVNSDEKGWVNSLWLSPIK